MIGSALQVHRELGPGFLESVYQKSLANELRLQNIGFLQSTPLMVHYKGNPVGQFIADFIVEDRLILELKASVHLTIADEAQLVNYLKATSISVGLLLNFGSPSLEVKRKVHRFKPNQAT